MGFGFTEAQEMFRREVANFVQRELAPGAKERAKQDFIDRGITKKLGDMGFLGLNLPEKYGGQPADWVSIGIAVEELSKAGVLGAWGSMNSILIPNLLQASEEVQQEWIPSLIKGDKLLCFGVTEPDSGSDATAMKSRATRDGDFYVINGEKTSLTVGMQADACMLFVKTDPKAGARGITLFLVPLDLPGITKSVFRDMGWLPFGRASLIFDEVKVPSRYRLGEEGKGFYAAMGFFDSMRIFLGLPHPARR